MTLLPSQYVNGLINSHSEGSQRHASMLSTCSVRALGSLAPALGAARPGIQMKVWGAKGRRAQLDRRPSQYWCQPWCGVWRCMHRPDEISKMHETRATDIPRDHLHLHLWVTRGRLQSSSLPTRCPTSFWLQYLSLFYYTDEYFLVFTYYNVPFAVTKQSYRRNVGLIVHLEQ